MGKKADPEIRVKRRNLKDLIRDEIYGAGKTIKISGAGVLVIEMKKVSGIANRIARRALIGPK